VQKQTFASPLNTFLAYIKKLCSHTTFFFKNFLRKVCNIQKLCLPLQRYPENNLFTLKELIPIEDRSDRL